KQNKQTILFTDRPIYRPGQTVYYTGILIESNTQGNSILPSQEITVSFKDVNKKEIENAAFITNVFGSFQGSFNIPQGKLNGRMSLTTEYGSVSILVEEYKRPTFEVTFEPATQKYKLNDGVKIAGKAISYAGYTVGHAKVSYTVMRRSLSQFADFGY